MPQNEHTFFVLRKMCLLWVGTVLKIGHFLSFLETSMIIKILFKNINDNLKK